MRKEDWVSTGPGLEALVSHEEDRRRKERAGIALVMPCLGQDGTLRRHLAVLAKQTHQDFDLIIVRGEGDVPVDQPGLSILSLFESGRNGSAGAYYIGEKRALRDGYRKIVLADYDCLPLSGTLLAEFAISTGDLVLPHIIYAPSGDKRRGDVLHHYGCLSREALLKSGLTFLPLYFGGEDYELAWRLRRAGIKASYIGSAVTHPANLPPLLGSPGRKYLCGRGELETLLLHGRILEASAYSFLYLMSAVAFWALGRGDFAWLMARSLWSASGFEFFSGPEWPVSGGPLKEPVPEDAVLFQISGDSSAAGALLGSGGRLSAVSRIAGSFGYFGKDVVLKGSAGASELPIMVMARRTFFDGGNGPVVLFRERRVPSIILGLVALAVSAVPAMAGAIAIAARGGILYGLHPIRTVGYGSGKRT
ncbi:MAG: hypothetical protein U0R44_00495 [Candidatus Micrarchaeia archaeon]